MPRLSNANLRILLIAFTIVAVVVVATGSIMISLFGGGDYHVQTVRSANDVEITIRANRWYEQSRGLHFELYHLGKQIRAKRHLGHTFEPTSTLQFQLVTAAKGNVVALVEASAPRIVLAIYDCRDQSIWPDSNARSLEAEFDVAHRLIDELQRDHPAITFISSHEVVSPEYYKVGG